MVDRFPQIQRAVFFAGLLIYAVTAYHSQGFHQADEHFQIIEPTLKITQNRPLSELPWEFPAKMRPAGQIWLTVFYTKIVHALGIENRFTQITILRILIGILSFFLLWRLTKNLTTLLHTPQAKLLALTCVAFLWFMPYLHSRHSSELISTLAFIAGLNFLFAAQDNPNRASLLRLAAGFFICASFWFRFQMAFAILPLICFLILSRPQWQFHLGFGQASFAAKIKPLAILLAGAVICSAIAILADRLFYGETVLTPWHYFRENLLLGKAATFGVSPWWGYLRSFFKAATQPIAAALAVAVIFFIIRNRLSFIPWIFIVFLGIHFAISHKELRFLFPLAVFFPAILAFSFDTLWLRLSDYSAPVRIALRSTAYLLIAINSSALLVSTFVPADPQVAALKALSDIKGSRGLTIANDSLPVMRVGVDPFVFFAPSLPVTLFTPAAKGDDQAGIFYRVVLFEKIPVMPALCEIVAQSWWHRIRTYLPEDVLYTDRFSGYQIQKCRRT